MLIYIYIYIYIYSVPEDFIYIYICVQAWTSAILKGVTHLQFKVVLIHLQEVCILGSFAFY